VPRPRIDIAWKAKNGETGARTIELADAALEAPRVVSARVKAGSDRVEELTVAAAGKSYADASRAARLADALREIQQAGAFPRALAYERVDHLTLAPEFGTARMARTIA